MLRFATAGLIAAVFLTLAAPRADAQRAGQSLDDGVLRSLQERTEGWAIGLQLAGPVFDQKGRWVAGVRNDRLKMEIEDRLQAGGIDNSGTRDYDETNYSLGYSHE